MRLDICFTKDDWQCLHNADLTLDYFSSSFKVSENFHSWKKTKFNMFDATVSLWFHEENFVMWVVIVLFLIRLLLFPVVIHCYFSIICFCNPVSFTYTPLKLQVLLWYECLPFSFIFQFIASHQCSVSHHLSFQIYNLLCS